MRISIRRLANGDLAPQRIELSAADRETATRKTEAEVRPAKAPVQERSFIEVLLGERGRAIVARINPRFRHAKLDVVKVMPQ